MTTNTPQPNVPGDEVDRLLTAYFRAQMPAKWPAAPVPSGGISPPARQNAVPTDPTAKSRWALAASVALLIGSCWYLSEKATDGHRRPDTNLTGTTADVKHAKDAGKEKPKMP
ncbi:MAG: hypothetical protein J2P46_15630 [Zavarzinella sp.]|nr:hypothetical protein [Zavarzinella sp.]